MTVEEVQAWMRTTTMVDSYLSHDKSGNKWESKIFETPRGLLRVYLCNGRPCQNRKDGHRTDDYSPHLVRKVVKQIEQTQYETLV